MPYPMSPHGWSCDLPQNQASRLNIRTHRLWLALALIAVLSALQACTLELNQMPRQDVKPVECLSVEQAEAVTQQVR
jgi:hypothetical protein